MSAVVARKSAEVKRKLSRLDAELAEWLRRSESEDDPFATHHSQIRRIKDHLAFFRQKVEEKMAAAGQSGRLLEKWQNLTELILMLNQIWAFYRSKLAQRQEDLFKNFLDIADELAWECYRPAQENAEAGLQSARKEPPLLFLSGHLSPFALARENPYQVPGLRDQTVVKTVLNKLPIPVIGVPWSLAGHLPAALVIGHEAGHAVEDDFDLTPTLRARLTATLEAGQLPAERLGAWTEGWLGEVFADVYGCLAAGPAFAGSLIDFLAASEVKVRNEKKKPDDAYPTRYLRVLLCLETLAQIEALLRERHAADDAKRANVKRLEDARRTIESEWRGEYPSHAMPEYEADLPAVVEAILAGPYPTLGGVPLPEVLVFDGEQQKQAELAVKKLALGVLPATDDVRALLAAGWLSYNASPADFDKRGPILQNRLVLVMKGGVRALRGLEMDFGVPGGFAAAAPAVKAVGEAAEEAWALIESLAEEDEGGDDRAELVQFD